MTKRVATLTSEEWRRFLLRASEILNRGGNTVDTMTALAQQVLRFCNARHACVYLFNEANELDGFINVGLDVRTAAEAEKYGHTQWLTSYFKSPGGPMLHSVDGGSGYPSPLHKLADSGGFRAMLSLPLTHENMLRGLALVYFEDPPDLSAASLDVLDFISRFAGLAIANARLVETRKWERQAQDQFLDMLSHELRTPLTSIMGFAQIIRRRIGTSPVVDSRLREHFEMLWAQAQRLNRLLDTFVDISNIERGDFTIVREPLDIIAVVRSALDQSQMQIRSRHSVRFEVPARPLWVDGDTRRLEHVFSHIIGNAIRYSSEDTPITVTCEERKEGKEVVVTVADSGPGIPTDLRRKIFNRFYPTEARRSGGLGVGLYVSRSIVQAHGGRLTMESYPGEGTTVQVCLPEK